MNNFSFLSRWIQLTIRITLWIFICNWLYVHGYIAKLVYNESGNREKKQNKLKEKKKNMYINLENEQLKSFAPVTDILIVHFLLFLYILFHFLFCLVNFFTNWGKTKLVFSLFLSINIFSICSEMYNEGK